MQQPSGRGELPLTYAVTAAERRELRRLLGAVMGNLDRMEAEAAEPVAVP